MCADSRSVFPTWQKLSLKKDWLKGKDFSRTITTEGEIITIEVCFDTDYEEKPYIMDCITGTCYKQDGSCLTSDHLKILSSKKEPYLHLELLATKGQKGIGA